MMRLLILWRARYLQWHAARIRIAATDLLRETEHLAALYRKDAQMMFDKARAFDHAGTLLLIEVNQERIRRNRIASAICSITNKTSNGEKP